MIKVFVHNFNDTVSSVHHFERLVNDYIDNLESDPKIISYSTEMFCDSGRLIYVVSIDEMECDRF